MKLGRWAVIAVAGAMTVAGVATSLALTGPSSNGVDGATGHLYGELGTGDSALKLIGGRRVEGGYEAWGYRRLMAGAPPPTVDGKALEFGASAATGSAEQLVLMRRRAGDQGWVVADVPRDSNGDAHSGIDVFDPSARLTPAGGAVLAGRDPARPAADDLVLLHRQPDGPFKLLASPPDSVLAASGTEPERIGDLDQQRLPIAAFDQGERTGVLVAATGPTRETGVVRFDDGVWSREAVELPTGATGDFKIVALAATSLDNAWMLAHSSDGASQQLHLLKREEAPGAVTWRAHELTGTPFAAGASGSVGSVMPLAGRSQSLTATPTGVWIDAAAQVDGASRPFDFTLYFSGATDRPEGTWCDASSTGGDPICDRPLGFAFSSNAGYRSFAWNGKGSGTRVVTNPLDPSGSETSNGGTYVRFDNEIFERRAGPARGGRPSAAFSSLNEGWLEGPVQVTEDVSVPKLPRWPVALRTPLTAIAAAPQSTVGSIGAEALVVGDKGAVARFKPDHGWQTEFLLSSTGAVSRPALRGVAWPEPGRAHAVGDNGAMWQWRDETNLWERDAAAPPGLDAHLLDVAFDPVDPQRGFAVGRGGVLLSYGKTWEQMKLPDGVIGDLTQVAFAGREAIVAAGSDLLVHNGDSWKIDESVREIQARRPGKRRFFAVGGLPDGSAVAAGDDGLVLVRDGAGMQWRETGQPLHGVTAVAAAAIKEGGSTRAILTVVPERKYPPDEEIPLPDPTSPPPLLAPIPLPGDGYLLRETADGWRDLQRAAPGSTAIDKPVKDEPVLRLALDEHGAGWAVGGWSGQPDASGRGSSDRRQRDRVQTAAVFRVGSDPSTANAPGQTATTASFNSGPLRFAVGGHSACVGPCARSARLTLGPDRTLQAALGEVGRLSEVPEGPAFMLYTGGRISPAAAASRDESERYAALLGDSRLPVFPAMSEGDATAGAAGFRAAFAGFPAPLGSGAMSNAATPVTLPGAEPAGEGALTHYAFDSHQGERLLRVVVIDNSAGSLASSDPHQNPPEPQRPWLQAVLDDAKSRAIPIVVLGSRDLNDRFSPRLNAATDGRDVAELLVGHGASAYFFDRPEESRGYAIPAGGSAAIPSWGSGTLGYRPELTGTPTSGQPSATFSDTGFLIVEAALDQRDPATNRVPVSVRLLPVIEDLSLESIDGTTLRRSRAALFRGLGRRPTGGDRWGPSSTGAASPGGSDPHLMLPPEPCTTSGCHTRIEPEFEFTSSDPDIGAFVARDPDSTSLRKPLIGPDGKTVPDSRSGLFCAYNAGQTTIAVSAGSRRYSQVVTVQSGSVDQPCGTRPLDPTRFAPAAAPGPPAAPVPPAAAPPAAAAPPVLSLPAPLLLPPDAGSKSPASHPRPQISQPPPVQNDFSKMPQTALPPPAPAAARPIPPGGAMARVFQVEEKREEEVATEDSLAFSRYEAGGTPFIPGTTALLLLVAVAAAAAVVAPRESTSRKPQAARAFNASTNRRKQ